MAKDNAELQALAQPQSRNEEFLNYLAGRAVDLNLLPDPQSRVEEYLQYLCYNRGQGGGGQQFVGLTNATINNNIITFYRSDGTSFTLNLKDLNLDKLINAVNLADTKIIFTKVDGTTFEVDLEPLLVADKIKYNNAVSGLTADNVKDAIDEINGKFVEDITFDTAINPATSKPKNTLKKIINGAEQEVVSGLVTKWEDLSDTHKLTNINLFNPLTVVYGERYNITNGNIENANGWARVIVDVEGGNDYTVIKNAHDSQTYVFLDAQGVVLERIPKNSLDENGRKKYLIPVPQQANNTQVAKLGFNISPDNKDTIEDIMVFKGAVAVPNQTIPFTNGADVVVDGSMVSIAFDNRNANLLSQTVAGAINEINNKVELIGTTSIKTINSTTPNTNGNIEVSMTNNVDNISFAVSGVEYGKLDYMTQVDVDEIKAIFV